jgi:hypothetical protein
MLGPIPPEGVPGLERNIGPMVGEFLWDPTDPHAETEPARAQHVEGGDAAGQIEQVVLEDHRHAGPEQQASRRHRRRGE